MASAPRAQIGIRPRLHPLMSIWATASFIANYGDQAIDVADASNVVLADHYRTTTIVTLDRCHFEVLQPIKGDRFTVLPHVRLGSVCGSLGNAVQ